MITSSTADAETVETDVVLSGSLSQQTVECICVPSLNTYNVFTMDATMVNETGVNNCTAHILMLSLRGGEGGGGG